MTIKHTINTTALTVALIVGAGTAAFAGGSDGAGSGEDAGAPSAARITALCEHQDEIVPRLTARAAKLAERITRLTELQAKADTKGKAKLVERIAKRIIHLQEKQDRVNERIAGAPAWIVEHCS